MQKNKVRIHYDNQNGFADPVAWIWVTDGATQEREIEPAGEDDFGVYFDFSSNRSRFSFLFKDGKGADVDWEDRNLARAYHRHLGMEIWSMANRHNIYNVRPAAPRGQVEEFFQQIAGLVHRENFYLPSTDVSGYKTPSMLGANILRDGSIQFGFFHPRAARVYLTGNFNDWQCPGHPDPRPEKFMEMGLYRGFYDQPNIWLTRIGPLGMEPPLEYKFFLQGGSTEVERYVTDPYTRLFSDDYKYRNSVVVDPTRFEWTDQSWKTPAVNDLIIYELNIYGFTDNDSEIPEDVQGTFKGVTQRIQNGYFDELGVTAIALMPTTEVPVKKGLGYEPCTFMSVEQDFGAPDDFREMVNEAHRHGLAVLADQVFNHTSNEYNPLWNLIDDGSEGGLYFAGQTMWGNKVATGKDEVDNMLIDACKLLIKEYHIDGFRFDATHSYFLNHRMLLRLAHEIKDSGFKPDAVLIAENLPNESDLNLDGYNGYAQWGNLFHDKLKALLREGTFEGANNDTSGLGSMFYFSKNEFAAHTNNVVNYCESHDENSVQFEVGTSGVQEPAVKRRKARLGLMATMVALGQPMIYMGQEFGIERERNRIKVPWDRYSVASSAFYKWTKDLINLRKRYAGLKISGYNPAAEGRFDWVIAPWMAKEKGGQHRAIGWRSTDVETGEGIMVLLNFEDHDVWVELAFPDAGCWVKLADIQKVNDLPPAGNKSPRDPDSIIVKRGVAKEFVLPPHSGFIYKATSFLPTDVETQEPASSSVH